MSSLTNHLYRFGEFSLDAQSRVLKRAGAIVPLTPKAFDALLLLVQNAGRIVTKDELMKAVWPDSFVEESNLTQTIFMVRKALDETSDRRYILTIQGQGYRFLVPVTESEQNLSHLVEVVKLPTGTVESAPPSGDKIDGHRLDSPVFAPTTTTLPLRRRPYVAVSTLAVLACVLLGIGYVTYQRQLARTHPALAQ